MRSAPCRSAPVQRLPRSRGVMPSTCRSRKRSRRSSRRRHTVWPWRHDRSRVEITHAAGVSRLSSPFAGRRPTRTVAEIVQCAEPASAAFDNMGPEDAFWASRIVARLTSGSCGAIVEKAKHTKLLAGESITQVVLQRWEKALRHNRRRALRPPGVARPSRDFHVSTYAEWLTRRRDARPSVTHSSFLIRHSSLITRTCPMSSLVPQRHDRIDPCRAAAGDQAGCE
jgi:hypothetical protein